MTGLPLVTTGTVLRLAPGEWCGEDRMPVWARTDIRVERIQADTMRGATAVWVTGHAIECAYTSTDCTAPCMILLVQTLAILRQVSR